MVGRRTRRVLAPLLVGTAVLAATTAPTTALGQAGQATAHNVELVGHSDLGGRGLNAAVWGHRNFAYVGTWGRRGSNEPALCPGLGVTVVDIADPTRPSVVGSVAQKPGTSAEDVHVLTVDTAAFSGDLLATGIQRCSNQGVGGLSLWDVTDPTRPAELGFFDTGRGPGGVHEFSLFQRDGRTIGLLAVPFSETLDPEQQGDLRIVDLTDPRAPTQLSHWGLARALGIGPRSGLGRDSQNYAHSVRASPDGNLAYIAYWDAGVVILDISDLRAPRAIGRTAFDADDEGNAHSTALVNGSRILVEADEDYWIRSEAVAVSGVPGADVLDAAYGAFRALAPPGEGVVGALAYVGRGCPAGPGRDGAPSRPVEDPYLADPNGRIAMVDRGDCTFVEKVQRAQQAGALGVVIANPEPSLPAPDGDIAGLAIPAAVIRAGPAAAIKDALQRGGDVAVRLGAELFKYDEWGYLRFWDVGDPANPVQVGEFATPHARPDPRHGPPDDGWYTVHQPVVLGDRLYASWYSDGVRVLDVADPTRPREVGFFLPPVGPPTPAAGLAARPQGPFVWGVYVRGDLVLASDHHTGLYLLRDLTR